MKKLFVLIMAFVISFSSIPSIPVSADGVRPTSVKIAKTKMTVYKGSEFEVKAKIPSKADDDYLRWTIVSGKGVIAFDDDDRNDDEIELKAKKTGTAVLKCYVKGKSKIKDTIKITVKKPTYKFSRVGKAKRTVTVGKELELKVKKSGGTKDSHLKWTIQKKSILKFDDGNKGDDVELKAKKAGTTKVYCTNTKTKKKITFTVTVKKKKVTNSSDYGDSGYSDYGDSGYSDYDD